MKSERPPALASWLLEHLCDDPALAGDLLEEYRARRSAGWYWKQAIAAVRAYSVAQIVEHKWLAVRAIVVGFLIWYVFNVTLLKGIVRPWLGQDTMMLKAAYFALAYGVWLANGWVIAKLHRPYSSAMVLAFAIWTVVTQVPPIYALVVGTFDGSATGSDLAWALTLKTMVTVIVVSGGVLAVSRDPFRGVRTGAQEWSGDSSRAVAAR